MPQLDEFQDVAHAQYRLLFALTCNGTSNRLWQRVTIVGDGDQAIYDWRGADVRLFEVQPVSQNHCCAQPISPIFCNTKGIKSCSFEGGKRWYIFLHYRPLNR